MSYSSKPNILAIYLPQFYETDDNDKWWGKGFTDWVSVKRAECYFEGHNAPKTPLGYNYYDLSCRETLEWQAALAKKYGIYGFCFYHYYFKDGKKELELPAENLLRWQDIDIPFCFNWANESWVRSWSNFAGNVWTEKYEPIKGFSSKEVLVEQNYGSCCDWEAHFDYLLPFFKDRRYIKKDNRPVFIFYHPDDISSLKDMTALWRNLAKKAGFDDMYLIGANIDAPNKYLDAAIIYEPRNSILKLNKKNMAHVMNGVRCFEYEDIWNEILATSAIPQYKSYFCGVSGYDDTPRRGRKGECIVNETAYSFKKYFTRLLQKSAAVGNEFVFINAWNEWGEGMYLEPDELNQYQYLEAIKHSLDEFTPVIANEGKNLVGSQTAVIELDYKAKKFKHLFEIIDRWLTLEQSGNIQFAKILNMENVYSVAIYGLSSMGKHLLFQLRRENINVIFGIDRYVGQVGANFVVYRPEEDWPYVDAIIVTAYDKDEIIQSLRSHFKGKIFDLEQMIFGMSHE